MLQGWALLLGAQALCGAMGVLFLPAWQGAGMAMLSPVSAVLAYLSFWRGNGSALNTLLLLPELLQDRKGNEAGNQDWNPELSQPACDLRELQTTILPYPANHHDRCQHRQVQGVVQVRPDGQPHPEASGHTTTSVRSAQRGRVVGMVLGSLQCLHKTNLVEDRSRYLAGPLMRRIENSELQRVHGQLLAQLINDLLRSKGSDRRTWRSVG